MTASTHINAKGVDRRGRRHGPRTPAPTLMKEVESVGRNAHLHYDPKTGRKLSRERKA
jgi:hypothetical protein